MINKTCNLRCPYCFANEFVNKSEDNITLENFKKAVDFLLSSQGTGGRIGIIGGEPTIHPQFQEIIESVVKNDKIKSVVLFTNGIKIDEYIDILSHEKIRFLINLNSYNDIGVGFYNEILNNIELLLNRGKKNDINLGLNIYSSKQDFSFFFNVFDNYDLTHARISIIVPNGESSTDGFINFKELKDAFYNIIIELMSRNISYGIDCNKPPRCIWTEEEIEKIKLIGAESKDGLHGISFEFNKCYPVIDILPDLTAVRCFGLSDVSKVNISDFNSFDDLRKYYLENIDKGYIAKPLCSDCKKCDLFGDKCYGGCLSNKKICL